MLNRYYVQTVPRICPIKKFLKKCCFVYSRYQNLYKISNQSPLGNDGAVFEEWNHKSRDDSLEIAVDTEKSALQRLVSITKGFTKKTKVMKY